MRVIALDIGERRIGIAVSENGILASPHSILRRKSKKEDFARLGQLISEFKAQRVVVGLPYSLSGDDEMGPQARRIKRYAEALAANLTVAIDYFDESYSTAEAKAMRTAMGRKKSNTSPKSPVDDLAAAVILQNYLDAQHNKSAD